MEGVFEVNGSGKRLLHCENPLPEFLIGPQKFISGCFDFFFFFFRKQEANLLYLRVRMGERKYLPGPQGTEIPSQARLIYLLTSPHHLGPEQSAVIR